MLYASDFPYGQQPSSLLIALRTARVAGLSDDQIRDMLAGNANRIADGEPPLDPTPAKGSDTFTQPMVLARIHQYLSMATPLLWTRQADTVGVLGLALNACDERNGSPLEDLGRIKELLLCARDLWRAVPEIEDETGQDARRPADLPAHPPRRHRRGHARRLVPSAGEPSTIWLRSMPPRLIVLLFVAIASGVVAGFVGSATAGHGSRAALTPPKVVFGMCPIPDEFRPSFVRAAGQSRLPLALLAAVASVESKFRPDVHSTAGAHGLLQVLPCDREGAERRHVRHPTETFSPARATCA